MPTPGFVLIAHNVRSCHNVGSFLRSADAFGVSKFIATGYTPYPRVKHDSRINYLIDTQTKQIAKTALGAEQSVSCEHYATLDDALRMLRQANFCIYALEQSQRAISLHKVKAQFPAALIVGNEVNGLSESELVLADTILEIPMRGHKESLNVSVAAGIALYELARIVHQT